MLVLASVVGLAAGSVRGADVQQELQDLRQANTALQAQLREQRGVIELLSKQMAQVQQTQAALDLRAGNNAPPASASGIDLGRIHLSGEAGVGFFHSGKEGITPNSEFRVDEAKLFFEAPVWKNVYAFGELNLAAHEGGDLSLNVGELYLDVEDVSQLWGRERQLNVRAGRLDVPFGEEYLRRDAIDNVLISHSLADFWGVDEGVEIYGTLGKFSYVVAVQNGGDPAVRDFTGDKSVTARLGFDPTRWLHLSVSGMRTGEIDVQNEYISAIWFGGGWFAPVGSFATTTRFHANMVQGDVRLKWQRGHLAASGGYICYDDNDTAGSNHRGIYHYAIEAQQNLTPKLYVAERFSQIVADKGYLLTGNGNMGDYFNPSNLTKDLWRLSLGLGYRFGDNLLVKSEYTFEGGRAVSGAGRDHEDLFALEAAVKF